jgi:hypothetical protein
MPKGAHTYHQHTSKSVEKSPKIHKVMHEFKYGTLHSGSKQGPKVTSRKQAVAIAISEAKNARKK